MASIKKRGKTWQARWRTPDGASRSQAFRTRGEAEDHLTTVEHSKSVGGYVDRSAGNVTVADYWPTWAGRQHWRDSSRAMVRSYFTNHVEPVLGRRRLNTLRRGDVEAWTAGLALAPRTARQVTQYVSTMLDAAVADGLIATNPARGSARPKVSVAPISPLGVEDVEALRSAVDPWFAVALDLGLGAGLRQSEAAGLTIDRVDFLRRHLVVDRQLVSHSSGAPTFGPPKTQRGYRTVPLADSVVVSFARHIEVHGTGEHGLVLHGVDGAPMGRQRFGVAWRRARKAAGLPAVRFHDTRHTYASTLLSGGVSVAAAAEYLGDSPMVLLSTYAHLMPGDHDRARSVVEAAFGTAARSAFAV